MELIKEMVSTSPNVTEVRKAMAELREAGFYTNIMQYIDDEHQNHAWYNGCVAEVFCEGYVCEVSAVGRVAMSVQESGKVIAKTDTTNLSADVLSDLGMYIPDDVVMCSVLCGENPGENEGLSVVVYEHNRFEWRLFDIGTRQEFRYSDDTMHEFDTVRLCDCLEPNLLEDLVFGLVKEV